MNTRILKTALVAALTLVLPLQGQAAKKKTGAEASPTPGVQAPAMQASQSPAAAEKSERPIPFHGKIASADAGAKQFTLATKLGTGRTLKVTDKTVLTKAGNPATFADVTKDEEVRGSYFKKPDGSLEAKSVKLGPLTPAEQAAKAAKTNKAKPTP